MDLAYCVFFADSDVVDVLPRYAGTIPSCLKSDDNCICATNLHLIECVENDRLDKTYVRAVRTVPLSAGAGGAGGSGQGAATLGNGDVNGDDSLDLSDAIYLLAFLFQGGPEPVPCPGGGGGGPVLDVNNIGRLTSTLMTSFGVTGCYEEIAPDDWGMGDCATVPCPGQDGFYEAEGSHSCQGTDRFVNNGDGTVTDHCTNLMWTKGRPWPTPEPGGRLDWHQGLAFVETAVFTTNRVFKDETDTLEAGETVVYDDWRMPNIREVETIRDYTLVGQNLAGPLQARRAAYFSSTTVPTKPSRVFGFSMHSRSRREKNNPILHVRPVRTVTVTP
jgi:hypothetical protein